MLDANPIKVTRAAIDHLAMQTGLLKSDVTVLSSRSCRDVCSRSNLGSPQRKNP